MIRHGELRKLARRRICSVAALQPTWPVLPVCMWHVNVLRKQVQCRRLYKLWSVFQECYQCLLIISMKSYKHLIDLVQSANSLQLSLLPFGDPFKMKMTRVELGYNKNSIMELVTLKDFYIRNTMKSVTVIEFLKLERR